MGGFFGAISSRDVVVDVFFGTDYHSHLGTRRGGMACWDKEKGFQRSIHNIENSPFRTEFEEDLETMRGNACIGCISDTDPQPLLVRSRLGTYAVSTVGRINNMDELAAEYLNETGGHFESMSGSRLNQTELVAALIGRKATFAEGIRYAQEKIDGTMSILILTEDNGLIAARDRVGRLPVLIGRDDDGYCVSFESFAYRKLGYRDVRDLGPGEIVALHPDGFEVLAEAGNEMRICAFLWTYYGYPNSRYEGVNVESMRNRNGAIMAQNDARQGLAQSIDYVCGVPDSGIPHAIGYANASGVPFSRSFIKYTPTWPRSFMPGSQTVRNVIARMKLIPVPELIENKRLLFVDDSIVRGTQLHETVDFLYNSGAAEVHMRSACPPIMYGCKYLNFSPSRGDHELIARRTVTELEGRAGEERLDEYADGSTERGKAMRDCICQKLKLSSLEFQTLDGLMEAIGLEPCKICTYCWNGKE